MSLPQELTNIQEHVTTRNGAPVVLFCYLKGQVRSYLGAFYHKENWIACSWRKDGRYIENGAESDMDLVVIHKLSSSTTDWNFK